MKTYILAPGSVCPAGEAKLAAAYLAFKEVGIDFNIALPFFGNSRFLKDGSHGAGRFTGTAVNALVWINIELFCFLEPVLIRRRMNAIYRANIDARSVFHADTWLGNYIGHCLAYPAFHKLSIE
jgi:hypothetical protein